MEQQVRTEEKVTNIDTATISTQNVSSNSKVDMQACGCNNGRTNNGITQYIYAIGKLRAAFPSKSIENEFLQAISRTVPTITVPDDKLFYEILSQGQNLYIAREMCWILQIDGIDAYIVQPRTYVELYNFIVALAPVQQGDKKYDTIIGPLGPIAPPSMCNGLQLPIIVSNQDYHFTFNEFVAQTSIAAKVPTDVVVSMFESMLSVADNAGETDEHRAINYVTLRYIGIYQLANQMLTFTSGGAEGAYTLTKISAKPSAVQGTRRIVDIIFQYTERNTGELINWFVKVDVTGQFPFLVTKLARYFSNV